MWDRDAARAKRQQAVSADDDELPVAPRATTEPLWRADERLAEAEALLGIANRRIKIAARAMTKAGAAEREHRRTIWHYSQLMRDRISSPLQSIIGMVDALRAKPDLAQDRRLGLLDAISQ